MLGAGQKITPSFQRTLMERKWRPNTEVAPNCPRCESTNTKFCYYNNYSLTQPRYFCKTCRRYWTKGGSLRNVPVGGGCRKKRRGKSMGVSIDVDPYALDSNGLSPESNLSGNCHRLEGGTSSTGAPDIDLALVYEKFMSQQPEEALSFDQSQSQSLPVYSQPNSGPLLPEMSPQFGSSFEVGIAQGPDFRAIQADNEICVQLQTLCDQDALRDSGVGFHELGEEGCYEFGGLQCGLGIEGFASPTIPSSNWQYQALEEAPKLEQFGLCTDFVPNCWNSADLQSYETLYHT